MIDPRAPQSAPARLAARARHGALATVSREPPGHPFATLVAVAFDPRGRPLLLLSRLAEHTRNLELCERASILVAEPTAEGDPLAAGRMTLVGECRRLPAEEQSAARALFVDAHPEAEAYAGFGDFAMWRLEVAGVRWVGGFGKMEWLAGDDYAEACAGSG